MSTQRVYLVVGADKTVRAARRPRVGAGEVAIAIDLHFPDTWGRVIDTFQVSVPDFAPQVEVDGEHSAAGDE